jgi:hypothetical protein
LLVRDRLDRQAPATTFRAQPGCRHTAGGERDLNGHIESQRCVGVDTSMTIRHFGCAHVNSRCLPRSPRTVTLDDRDRPRRGGGHGLRVWPHAQAEHRHVPGLLGVLPGRQLVGEQGGVLRSIRLLGRLAHGDGAVIQRISGRFLNLGILVGN